MNFNRAEGINAKGKVLFGKPADLDPGYGVILERKFLNVAPGPTPTHSSYPAIGSNTNYFFFVFIIFIVTLFEH